MINTTASKTYYRKKKFKNLHAVSWSKVTMYEIMRSQVSHSFSNLQANGDQLLPDVKDNILVAGIGYREIRSLFLQVREQAPLWHERHDNVRSWSHVNAHADKWKDVEIIEWHHPNALFNYWFDVFLRKHSYWRKNGLRLFFVFFYCTFQCLYSDWLWGTTLNWQQCTINYPKLAYIVNEQ